MSRKIMLIPIESGVGLTSISIGMVRAIEQQGCRVDFFKPVNQTPDSQSHQDKSLQLVKIGSNISPQPGFSTAHVEHMISEGNADVLMEEVIGKLEAHSGDTDILVIEGMVPSRLHPYANRVNREIASALGAEVVFVVTPGGRTPAQLEDQIEIIARNYGGVKNPRLIGCIVNKVGAEQDDEQGFEAYQAALHKLPIFARKDFDLLGCLPWQQELMAARVADLATHLKATIINEGDMLHRRLRGITFCARTVANMVSHFKPGMLLVTSGDRSDVIVAAALSALNGTKLGAILLTGGYQPEARIMALCEQAFAQGLPVLATETDTWHTSLALQAFDPEVPVDDEQRVEKVKMHVASHLDKDWLAGLISDKRKQRLLSPPAFRYRLTELARKAQKTIVLPEGNEPRTIKAASICGQRGIAKCILLGSREEITRLAEHQGIELGEGVTIVEPEQVKQNYVAPMVELRKHKGLTELIAKEQLDDNVTLGTMMLQQGEVDGLVSGAVHTTANTIRPPLQLIRTAPGYNLVSSIFFMLLPDQVLVYGDCAINPDPSAEQLADIAIQSADSAAAFGIEPKVAMISYSTGSSGQGSDVEKVREATDIAKQRRPDLIIDGPLQYDAAIMENVARKKAPDSPVAGKATVFIFPDLNTGNTTYKAVQRSAELVSIGPMLQGMAKPVNDLSRGALVDDIVYTIALTAIQSTQ